MEKRNPRIVVVGAGANGAANAADLIRAGLDVTLIDQWPDNVAAIRERGIHVHMPEEAFNVSARIFNVCDVATLNETFDIALILVKAYDAKWATQLIEPLLAPDGIAVGVQNGMTLDAIAEVVGVARTVGCVIEQGGAMFDPGVVLRATPPSKAWYAIGATDPSNKHCLERVAEVLGHSGTVEIVNDIRAAKWMKLVVNSAEVATSGLLDLALSPAIQQPGMRSLMLEVGCEAMDVIKVAGITVVPIFGIPDLNPQQPRDFIEKLLDSVVNEFAQPDSKTAILQDWMKGRRSEVWEMNGAIVALGRELGIPTPFNSHVLEMSEEVERGERRPSVENLKQLVSVVNSAAI